MAPDRFLARAGVRLGLVLALAAAGALGACGSKADEAADEQVDLAAVRARNDSIRKARAGATAAATRGAADSAVADSLGQPRQPDVVRETFSYGGGARDPFASLLKEKSTGPEFVDLQLVGVYENLADPAQSVAVVREKSADKRHKLRTGDRLGRLRVAAIRSKDVVFTVQDFGYERQETLSLRKPQEDDTP
ncbi:MAG TPA: hypothetical protein VFS40_16190 [Gemmatimonadales bacterium]|nr:hypothetical protein [Gemmatimonadales bacterium]